MTRKFRVSLYQIVHKYYAALYLCRGDHWSPAFIVSAYNILTRMIARVSAPYLPAFLFARSIIRSYDRPNFSAMSLA